MLHGSCRPWYNRWEAPGARRHQRAGLWRSCHSQVSVPQVRPGHCVPCCLHHWSGCISRRLDRVRPAQPRVTWVDAGSWCSGPCWQRNLSYWRVWQGIHYTLLMLSLCCLFCAVIFVVVSLSVMILHYCYPTIYHPCNPLLNSWIYCQTLPHRVAATFDFCAVAECIFALTALLLLEMFVFWWMSDLCPSHPVFCVHVKCLFMMVSTSLFGVNNCCNSVLLFIVPATSLLLPGFGMIICLSASVSTSFVTLSCPESYGILLYRNDILFLFLYFSLNLSEGNRIVGQNLC